MTCPDCCGKVTVADTVHITDTNEIYRKRKCLECGHVFYTTEFEVEKTEQFRNEWNKFVRKLKTKG